MNFKKVRNFLLATLLASGMLVTELAGAFGPIGGQIVAQAKVSDYQPTITGFEDGDTEVTPKPRYGGGTVSITGEDAHTGTKCAKITGRTENWHGICFYVDKYAGTKIHFKCWVKTAEAQAMLTAENDGTGYYHNLATVNSNGEWVLAEGDFEVKEELPSKYIYIEATGKGDIYVDDLEITVLEELKTPPQLGEEVVVNGGFEESADGWTGDGVDIEVTDVKKLSGEKSLQATVNETVSGNGIVAQDVSSYLKKGSVYEISYSWNSDATEELDAQLVFGEGDDAVVVGASEEYEAKTEQNGDWTTKTAMYVVPDDAAVGSASFNILFKDVQGKVFYLDDISIIEQKLLTLKTDGVAKKLGMSNPLTDTEYGADPFAMEYDGRIYIYSTNDNQQYEYEAKVANGFPLKGNDYGQINTINVMSSDDMVNWTNHGQIPVAGRNNENGIAKWAGNSWAPAAAHKTIDGKEKFFLYFADNGAGIGVLEADSPVGPFREPETGSCLIAPGSAAAKGVVWLFDPAVFVDDGTGYLYYGGGIDGVDPDMPKTSRVVKLKDNMVEMDGDPVVIEAPGIYEDSGIHKYNNKYYYTYCSNFSNNLETTGRGNICAMVSDSPMGPFVFDNKFLDNPFVFFGVGGNNHHAVFSFKDKWYVTYHAQTLGKAVGCTMGYRSVHINELTYDEDGHILPVTGTYEGVAQLESFDPYTRVEAETFAWQSGVTIADCTEDGAIAKEQNRMLNNIVSNSWVALGDVDFKTAGASKFKASIANKVAGGSIQLYLDDIAGEPVATLDIDRATDGQFEEFTWDVEGISGTHRLFMVFKGMTTTNGLNMDCWEFERIVSESDQKAADDAVEVINAIGDVALTEDSKAAIDAARAAYNALTEEQKDLVTKEQLKVLTDAEAEYAALVVAAETAANQKAADDAVAKINAIGTVALTDASKAAIAAARAAYNALTADQKALVTADQLKVLTDAEAKYAQLAATKVTKKQLTVGTIKTEASGTYVVTNATAGAAEVTYKVVADKNAKSVTVPATVTIEGTVCKVTKIEDNAFKGCKKLTKVTIPTSVETIGKNAFSGCSALKSITIPVNVKTIDSKAFNGCKNLKKITIKSTVLKKVGKSAFKGINKKATIKVPKKQKKAYQKLLKKKGQASTVKIK